MDPQDRIEGEVWRKHRESAIGQLSPESNEHGSHQALSSAVLSIAALASAELSFSVQDFFCLSKHSLSGV